MVHPTDNSLQMAPIHQPIQPDKEDAHRAEVPPVSGNVSANLPANPQALVPANVGILPEMAAFVAQMVPTAMATEQERLAASANASVTPSSGDSPSPAVVSTPGGVLASLNSSATSFLAAGGGAGGQLGQGRPDQSSLVPSFVSMFASPSMSSFVSSSAFVSAPQTGATHDVADRSNMLPALLLDQPFVVGPGFSPVPVKLVAQIVSGKYVDLSEFL